MIFVDGMSQNPQLPSNAIFYTIGALFLLIAIAFFLIPLLGRSGILSGVKIPWIILYTYKSGNFYFVTSPILIIISLVTLVAFLFFRR